MKIRTNKNAVISMLLATSIFAASGIQAFADPEQSLINEYDETIAVQGVDGTDYLYEFEFEGKIYKILNKTVNGDDVVVDYRIDFEDYYTTGSREYSYADARNTTPEYAVYLKDEFAYHADQTYRDIVDGIIAKPAEGNGQNPNGEDNSSKEHKNEEPARPQNESDPGDDVVEVNVLELMDNQETYTNSKGKSIAYPQYAVDDVVDNSVLSTDSDFYIRYKFPENTFDGYLGRFTYLNCPVQPVRSVDQYIKVDSTISDFMFLPGQFYANSFEYRDGNKKDLQKSMYLVAYNNDGSISEGKKYSIWPIGTDDDDLQGLWRDTLSIDAYGITDDDAMNGYRDFYFHVDDRPAEFEKFDSVKLVIENRNIFSTGSSGEYMVDRANGAKWKGYNALFPDGSEDRVDFSWLNSEDLWIDGDIELCGEIDENNLSSMFELNGEGEGYSFFDYVKANEELFYTAVGRTPTRQGFDIHKKMSRVWERLTAEEKLAWGFYNVYDTYYPTSDVRGFEYLPIALAYSREYVQEGYSLPACDYEMARKCFDTFVDPDRISLITRYGHQTLDTYTIAYFLKNGISEKEIREALMLEGDNYLKYDLDSDDETYDDIINNIMDEVHEILERDGTSDNSGSDTEQETDNNESGDNSKDQEGSIGKKEKAEDENITIYAKQQFDVSSLIPGAQKYKSSSRRIATVNKSGIVKGKNGGTVTIVGYVNKPSEGSKKKNWVEVGSVQITVEKAKMQKKVTSSAAGETFDANTWLSGIKAKPMNWMSSNTSVATVSDNGMVTVVGRGKTKISPVFESGSVKNVFTRLRVKLPKDSSKPSSDK